MNPELTLVLPVQSCHRSACGPLSLLEMKIRMVIIVKQQQAYVVFNMQLTYF